MNLNNIFRQVANKTASASGSPITFVLAVLLVIVWSLAGPSFDYSDTWQLVINTLTTVLTFLMVFLIQNTQNRDAKAVHLKLDELIRTGKGRNILINIESMCDEDLEKYHAEFTKVCEKYESELNSRTKSK